LVLSDGTLTFDKNTFSYAVSVPHAVDSLTVTPTAEHQTSRVKVNGVDGASGQASPAISLNPGHNEIKVEVTAGLENMGEKIRFADEDRIGAWAKDSVAVAVLLGIVNGYPDGSFRPDAPITRAEMAVMIARALGMNDGSETHAYFADDAKIPAWAKGAVATLKEQGLVQGRNGNLFTPQATVTRAEAAVLLLRVTDDARLKSGHRESRMRQ